MVSGDARVKAADSRIVVYSIKGRRESACGECEAELHPGDLIHLDDRRVARCTDCADLSHLIYLPRGNTALTRRATKYSTLSAVVLRWASARRRYERQATLVEEAALQRAEEECLADADSREARRIREAERRELLDARHIEDFAGAIRKQFPGCPDGDEIRIAEHACRKHSGRVGRSAAAKDLTADAVDLAVRAHVRHRWTSYDELLMLGRDRDDARAAVRAHVDELLGRWKSS